MAIDYYAILEDIKTKLYLAGEVKNVKIGMEKGIGSKDCPFIRIVANSADAEENGCEAFNFSIFYGLDIKNRDLETGYKDLYDIEMDIKDRLQYKVFSPVNGSGVCKFLSTQTDSDALDKLKVAVTMFTVEGLMP